MAQGQQGGAGRREKGKGGKGASSQGSDRPRQAQQGEPDDLKNREYRDEKGEIHHHTHTYMEQHGKEGGKDKGGGKH